MALFDNKKVEPKVVYVTKEKVVTKEVEKPVFVTKDKENSLLTSESGSINLGFKKDNKDLDKRLEDEINSEKVETKDKDLVGFGKQNDEKDIAKKYEGVDFSRFSKEKCFRVINELLIAIKRYQTDVNKSESENLEFYNKNKETEEESKRLKKQIEFLARKLSPSFNKYSIENKEQHLTPNQVINLILEDVLKDKKGYLEQIKALKDEVVKDKELLEELKRQLSEKLSEDFLNGEISDKSEFTKEDIKESINTLTPIKAKEEEKGNAPSKIALIGIDLEETRNSLGELEYEIIVQMGKTGVSLYPEILKYLLDKGYTESKVKTAIAKLEQYKVINGELVKTAKIKRGVKVYELTSEIGRLLYKEKSGLNAVESERSKVIKDHDNLVHGYSILETAKTLETLGYLDVSYSRKNNSIPIGQNKYYIPDIIGLNPITKQKEYFEVEFGNHNTMNFDEKLTKANLIARNLRFVVPSEIIKTNILNKVNHWKATSIAQKSTMKISIATITDLENKNFGIEIN